ncbi:MFS transporter [candidate division WWE3 bacterium]|uniref:MFS transporter n=1 Tax=candidate division WWE3 bacterium TaxID=2053526 RepID=A0A7X9HHH8_UNCKA|nr:MFS transporter [candidate division WWE3 bacterium]
MQDAFGRYPQTKKIITPMIIYSVIYFFLAFGDSLISYISPIIIEEYVNNALILGLIMATSSIFGIFFDFFSTRFWPNAKYSLFLRLTFITTIGLPILFLVFPKSIPMFLVGMAAWGAYYEFRGFASYSFIQKHVNKDEHTSSWATINAFSAIAYLVGPLLAVFLIDKSENLVLITALGTFLLALIIYFFSKTQIGGRGEKPNNEIVSRRSTLAQIKIVFTLFKSVWHLFAYTFALYMIDAAFWSIGILYTEELKNSDTMGGLFIVAYMVPSLFMVIIAPKIPKTLSKKRLSFIAGILAGTTLIFVAISNNVSVVLAIVLLMAIFLDFSFVLNMAVFEDYVARLGKFGNDMAGVSQAAISLAYIVGPVLWGWAAEALGYQKAFALSGVLLASVCAACLATVPRKVHMPQSQLKTLE